jgi:hypothetical protein
MQLIYASRPFGYDDLTLISILMQARENNARNGITGALICREDVFLQILEGPRDLVTSTFSRILRDERHVDVVNLLSSEIHGRLFPEWSMRHDPAQSWMWTPEEVARGAIGRASDREIRGIFERLARAMHVDSTCAPHPLAAKPTTPADLKSLRSARLKCRLKYCMNPLALS